jgi:hypothetical protein
MKTSALLMEYRFALGRVTLDDTVSEFRRHGVSMEVVAAVRPVPMKIVVDRRGELYEPHEEGRLAWVLPIRVVNPEIPDEIETTDPLAVISAGPVVDLLAFSPAAPGRYALRCGIANVLGCIPPQYCNPPPVAIFSDVTGWLRNECRGLVLLSRNQIELARVIRQCIGVEAEDEEHAQKLRRMLAMAHPVWPAVTVGTAEPRHD